MTISLIAAVDEKNGLGYNNQLLCHLPADLKYFKEKTLNKTIVMGHNTFLSIGRALPKRQNIVLTRKTSLEKEHVLFVNSLGAALNSAESEEIMIIGGAMLYRESIEQAQTLYITRIHHAFQADVFFPEIDETAWRCVSETPHQKDTKHAHDFTFLTYQRDPRRTTS